MLQLSLIDQERVMPELTRREALAAGAATLAAGLTTSSDVHAQAAASGKAVMKGRLKQSVSRWCYQKIPMPEFCKAVAAMGIPAIDLLNEPDWAVVRDFGLICSMGSGGGGSIAKGLNTKANHDEIVRNLELTIPKAAAQKVPNVITFFGNRQGMSDSEAIANCVEGLNRVKKVAEESNVTICVELLNSKVDHKDYHGDHTAFGVEIVKAVASPRVKLLYDIYHMQIMEGDIIRTIRDNKEYLAHFHTGGVPGRHELDATQELNWATVCTAIVDTGFQGYLAHEFVPTRDPLTSLREAVVLCDV
jgi:hydroxypyruvate isomerase